MTTIFDNLPTPVGKYRIRNLETGFFLLRPIDGWGKLSPEWEEIPEASMRFHKAEAQDQLNFLRWQYPQGQFEIHQG